MSSDTEERARERAVEQLETFGLSTYAARTFVALVIIGEGTAQDVAEVAEVPRTRVYDAAEELRDHGLVDVQRSSPRRFWGVSTETVARHFDREYSHRVNVLGDALEALDDRNRSSEQRGVWTVTGRQTVTDRVVDFVDGAEEEVAYMTVGELLTDPVVEALAAASARGVSINLAEMSDSTERRLDDRVPDADGFDSVWDWSDTPAGRLLMVDGTETLVSVLVPGEDDGPPEPRDETAIWGAGEANSLVVVLKATFTWQLDPGEE